MLEKILTAVPPDISDDNFEDCLASDDLLVHYFNEFLSFLVFCDPVKYNKDSGIFEVVSDDAESLSRKIRAALLKYKCIVDETKLPFSTVPDNSYKVLCLDREQGIQWVKKERLPLFLQSDCYFEYRLAKLLSQVDGSSLGQRLFVDPTYRLWAANPETHPLAPVYSGNRDFLKLPSVFVDQASAIDSGECFSWPRQSPALCSSWTGRPQPCSLTLGGEQYPHVDAPVPLSSRGFLSLLPKNEESTGCSAELPSLASSFQDYDKCKKAHIHHMETRSTESSSNNKAVQHVTASMVQLDLRDAVSEVNRAMECKAEASKVLALGEAAGEHVGSPPAGPLVTPQPRDESLELESEDEIEESYSHSGLHDSKHCNPKNGLEEFKSFLHGTSGEKLFYFWMDIERLKALQNIKSKNRHLLHMKDQYLLTGGSCTLSVEQLLRFDLTSTLCWREDKLYLVQVQITECLLLYWCPRFWMTYSDNSGHSLAHLRLWRQHQAQLLKGVDSYPGAMTPQYCQLCHSVPRSAPATDQQALPVWSRKGILQWKPLEPHRRSFQSALLRPASYSIRITMPWAPFIRCLSAVDLSLSVDSHPLNYSKKGMTSASGNHQSGMAEAVAADRKENMLQALRQEWKAGLSFARFCEQSGNQLWQNAIHFWTDLQRYHQLFCMDGPDPFRLQRQAQLLYFTYLCSSAQLSIGVGEECQQQVCAGLTPPFEELFDPAEEYVVSILQEPWNLLVAQDSITFRRVDLWEETRYMHTAQYQKLQALHRKTLHKLNQNVASHEPAPPPVKVPKEPDFWAKVPEQFRGYRLGSLLRHRLELQHFHSFLEENFASMDLTCWLEIEQFRRVPQKDRVQREEQSDNIRSKYLNRKYFFGPNSPANREEQEEVIGLGGGWGRLIHGRVSVPVLMEVQGYARRRIERKWLPLFLTTPQFAERQKLQVQVKDVVEDQIYPRSRKKREVWKHVDSAWMSMSKEILAFRRALLNPVTCRQFQSFVSLKGDFLENGVLFWLEVQKYKDLHHSHSDDAAVQQKVNAIISCFIDSSIPPALQIDIPPEQARDILERRTELGPYIFREAQMTVLGDLFKLWPEFLAFKRSVDEAQVLPLLESCREAQRKELKQQKIKEDKEKAVQEEAQKRKSSFAEDLFGDNGVYEGIQEQLAGEADIGDLMYPPRPVSWSYSRYMMALEQEALLLRGHVGQGKEAAGYRTEPSLEQSAGSRGHRGRISLPPVLRMQQTHHNAARDKGMLLAPTAPESGRRCSTLKL